MRVRVVFLCWLSMLGSLCGSQIFTERASSESIERAILVPRTRFRESELIRLSREFLAQHPERKAVKLFMATTKEAISETLAIPSHQDYLSFALQYRKPGWSVSWGLAEAIRLGGMQY